MQGDALPAGRQERTALQAGRVWLPREEVGQEPWGNCSLRSTCTGLPESQDAGGRQEPPFPHHEPLPEEQWRAARKECGKTPYDTAVQGLLKAESAHRETSPCHARPHLSHKGAAGVLDATDSMKATTTQRNQNHELIRVSQPPTLMTLQERLYYFWA